VVEVVMVVEEGGVVLKVDRLVVSPAAVGTVTVHEMSTAAPEVRVVTILVSAFPKAAMVALLGLKATEKSNGARTTMPRESLNALFAPTLSTTYNVGKKVWLAKVVV